MRAGHNIEVIQRKVRVGPNLIQSVPPELAFADRSPCVSGSQPDIDSTGAPLASSFGGTMWTVLFMLEKELDW